MESGPGNSSAGSVFCLPPREKMFLNRSPVPPTAARPRTDGAQEAAPRESPALGVAFTICCHGASYALTPAHGYPLSLREKGRG